MNAIADRPDRRVQVYEDAGGDWRWRRVAANGETTADSAEGYASKDGALMAVARELPDDPVEVLTD